MVIGFLLSLDTAYGSATTMNYLTKGYADTLYCQLYGTCYLKNLVVENQTTINKTTVNQMDVVNLTVSGNGTIHNLTSDEITVTNLNAQNLNFSFDVDINETHANFTYADIEDSNITTLTIENKCYVKELTDYDGEVFINDNAEIYGSLEVNTDEVWDNGLTIYGQDIFFGWFPAWINLKTPNTLGIYLDNYVAGAMISGEPIIQFTNATPINTPSGTYINTKTGEIDAEGISLEGDASDSNYGFTSNGHDVHISQYAKLRFGWEDSYILGDEDDLNITSRYGKINIDASGELNAIANGNVLIESTGGTVTITTDYDGNWYIGDDSGIIVGDNSFTTIGGFEVRTVDEPSTVTYKMGVTYNGDEQHNANLTIRDSVQIDENLNVTKNITGNLIYGQAYFNAKHGIQLNFATQDTYYNMTFNVSDNLNGFYNNTNYNLIPAKRGDYKVSGNAVGDGQNNHVYIMSIGVNGEEQPECHAQKKMSAGGDELQLIVDCIISLESGDEVSLMVQDYGGTGTGNYYTSNLNLIRIGG